MSIVIGLFCLEYEFDTFKIVYLSIDCHAIDGPNRLSSNNRPIVALLVLVIEAFFDNYSYL